MSSEEETKSDRKGFLSLPIIRDILVVGLIVVIAWKLMGSEIKIDLSAFSFNDFLSLALALFSVALSVAFYFKATDTSNQFYNNTYTFTKDMSEILGRIEAGFGERLKHLDEGYSGVKDRLDKIPYYGSASSEDVKKEEEEIRKKEDEQKAVIEDLARKAKISEHEKQALFANLARTNEELEQARIELRELQHSRRGVDDDPSSKRQVLRYVASKIKESIPSDEQVSAFSSSRVRRAFESIKQSLPRGAFRDLERNDLVDGDGDLTRDGLMYLVHELRRI